MNNNAALLTKLKHKNLTNNAKFLKQSNINTQEPNIEKSNIKIDPTILTDKYNPDVTNNFNKIYDHTQKKRKEKTFTHTTEIWKPIIGSVAKENITIEDFNMIFEKPDNNAIRSKYDIEMDKRLEEKKIADEMAKKYAEENNLNSTSQTNLEILTQIARPIGDNSEEIYTFVELKKSAVDEDTSKDTNDDNLVVDIYKLDDLMNSIKNL
jgi:ribosomal protein S17E